MYTTKPLGWNISYCDSTFVYSVVVDNKGNELALRSKDPKGILVELDDSYDNYFKVMVNSKWELFQKINYHKNLSFIDKVKLLYRLYFIYHPIANEGDLREGLEVARFYARIFVTEFNKTGLYLLD